jgi:hypothetical protein
MITGKGGKDVPCVMISHYLRYFERMHGTKLSPEMADKEAAKRKCFFWITVARDLTTRRTESTKEVPHDHGQAWTIAESF